MVVRMYLIRRKKVEKNISLPPYLITGSGTGHFYVHQSHILVHIHVYSREDKKVHISWTTILPPTLL